MCAFASKWCVRGVRPGSVSILYVPCVRVRVSGGGSVWGGGQLPEPTPRTPPLTNKRTHSACMMGQQPDPTPRTPPLTNKRTHGACVMGQEPDRTPIGPPTPWLSQTHTWIHRVYQEPGSTPSTTHTTAYLQTHAWSTHGVPEHDRASGMSAHHGCGLRCGFVCATCCGHDC